MSDPQSTHDHQGHHLPVAGSSEQPLYAIGARFESADAIVKAAATLRESGFTCFESYTPYPVHGLAEAMRLPKSILSFLVLGGGITAVLIALSLELIPSNFFYPLVVDGKPTNFSGLPQYIPITVALTLMIGAVTAVTGMITLGGMPRLNHPMFAWDLFERGASRSFFIAVEAHDIKFTTASVTELLRDAGGLDLIAIHLEAPEGSARPEQVPGSHSKVPQP
jgi:hypothetical protein